LPAVRSLPADDEQMLKDLANEICGDLSATIDKARAIERYFAKNFKYSLSSDPAANLAGRSAIRAFLEDRRDAHCVYFATATALLLRAQKIPSRLCLGYLVYEMNDENDYYVAANRNAHAWAEAYDKPTRRWIVVESTPEISDYVARFSSVLSRDSADHESADNLNANRSDSWILMLVNLLGGQVVLSILAVTVAAILVLRNREQLATLLTFTANRNAKYILKADRTAAKLGFKRHINETYHQFANRMRNASEPLVELATWYESYAVARYTKKHAAIALPPPPLACKCNSTAVHSQAESG
ncbi:MAG: transglutaminase domain-containing protein, partial [Planctomycetales bacterium]|nr:transglutaminase domain-containing protein [Planctomycetales bacterium]